MSIRFTIAVFLFSLVSGFPAPAESPHILPLKEQAQTVNCWLDLRLNTILPEIMRREKIDMWLVICREYNEDPVFLTLLPEPVFSARRLSMLLFFDRGNQGIEKAVIARYGIPPHYQSLGSPDQFDQWQCLAEAVRDRDPKRIGINEGSIFAFGDGLSASLKEKLASAIGPKYAKRLVSAERLCVGWLERRLPEELETYPRLVSIAHHLIREVFSSASITPGITTSKDLVWLFREKFAQLGLGTWFQPSVEIQRLKQNGADEAERRIIRHGDLLHCDIGIRCLRLNTDTQEMAYILKPGEEDAPEGLKEAMRIGNRLQDILCAEFKTGRSGNEILLAALAQMKREKINGSIYTHPLGFHGHAAGPTIGLWDQQRAIPGKGEYPLFPFTCYAIELNVKVPVPEWNNQIVQIGLEQDAVFDGESVIYLDGRQTELLLIR